MAPLLGSLRQGLELGLSTNWLERVQDRPGWGFSRETHHKGDLEW